MLKSILVRPGLASSCVESFDIRAGTNSAGAGVKKTVSFCEVVSTCGYSTEFPDCGEAFPGVSLSSLPQSDSPDPFQPDTDRWRARHPDAPGTSSGTRFFCVSKVSIPENTPFSQRQTKLFLGNQGDDHPDVGKTGHNVLSSAPGAPGGESTPEKLSFSEWPEELLFIKTEGQGPDHSEREAAGENKGLPRQERPTTLDLTSRRRLPDL